MRQIRSRIGGWIRRHTGTPGLAFFESFDAAARASGGYDDASIAGMVSEKTAILRTELENKPYRLESMSMQNLVAVSVVARGKVKISVVELGGACGAAFFEVDRFLAGLISSWTVIETSAMTQVAQENFASDRLRFVSELPSGGFGRVDLLVASGSLQFSPDPVGELHTLMRRYRPDWIYVSRTPFVEGDARFARYTSRLSDHGPGRMATASNELRSVALTIASRAELYSALSSEYEVELHFPDWGPPYSGVGLAIRDLAFLARRKS